MRTVYFLILFLCMFGTIDAQEEHKVGNTPENKKLLIEEFTGINCGHCPDGHAIANRIADVNKGNAFLINIHAGSFSTSQSGEPDFTTTCGDSLSDFFKTEMAGYPCAMINRHEFTEGTFLYGRNLWDMHSKTILGEQSPVNIYVESVYDDETKMLNIHVEGYNTEDNGSKDMKLNVLLTQDYIQGPQNGVPNSGDYMHMHVLRDYITSTDGAAIDNKNRGGYFTADFEYKLAEMIKNVELKPEDVNVIAFVTEESKKNVLNVAGGKPAYVNFNRAASGELYQPELKVGARYGYKYFEAYVKNNTIEHAEKAVFEIVVNDEIINAEAACDIKPFEKGFVKIPCSYDFNEKGIADYEIRLVGINDNNIEPKVLKGRFTRPLYTNDVVEISIVTDKKASENDFVLKDEDGNVIKTFGPFEDGSSIEYNDNVTLEEGKTYCMEIFDRNGDGMRNGKSGSLTTRTGNGKLIDQFYKINGYGVRSFFTVDNTLSINIIENNDEGSARTYNLQGMVINENDGSARIIIRNGKKIIK